MEKFISLALSMIIITWYYINSLKLNFYFRNATNWKYSILTVFIFTYIFFTVFFLLIDSMTITPDKEFLNFKQDFILNFIFIFEIFILIIFPIIYIVLLVNEREEEAKNSKKGTHTKNYYIILSNGEKSYLTNPINNEEYNAKYNKLYFYLALYFFYLVTLIILNFVYLDIDILSFFQNKNRHESKNLENPFKEFDIKVPIGIAKYAKISYDYHKIVYFNFGLLMMFGKFLGFTYLPYGMSLFVHDLIFNVEEAKNICSSPQLNANEENFNFNPDEKLIRINSPKKNVNEPQIRMFNEEEMNKISYKKKFELCEKKEEKNEEKNVEKNEEKNENNNCDDEEIGLLSAKKFLKKEFNEESSDKYMKSQSNSQIDKRNLVHVKRKNFKEEKNEENFKEKRETKTEKFSDENSNKSNFFTNSKSQDSNSITNSKYSYKNKSDEKDEYDEYEDSINSEEHQLENRKKNYNKDKKIKNSSLISIDENSKMSSLEANKNSSDNKKSKTKSDLLKNSNVYRENCEKTNNESKNSNNQEGLLLLQNKNFEFLHEHKKSTERKKSDNMSKILIIKKSKESLVTYQTLSESHLRLNFYFDYIKCLINFTLILLFLLTIFLIIYSKINILCSKLLYNICGVDCGYLSYRFGEKFTLDYIAFYFLNLSKSKYFRLDFFFLTFILIFRMLTLLRAFQAKGVSFLWKIFYTPDAELRNYQVLQLFATIFFTSIVLLYDFTYLMPDYLRFNGLNNICDYTLIHKDFCGLSFFGLLFLKISLNFKIFMYFDILASGIFITTGILWVFRLILNPLLYSLWNKIYNFMICKEDLHKEIIV